MSFQDYMRVDNEGPAFAPSPRHEGVWDFQPGNGRWYRVQPLFRSACAWAGSSEPPEYGGVIAAQYSRHKVHAFGHISDGDRAVCTFAAQLFLGLNPEEPEELAGYRRG